ncbi:class I SAM-dependent methyltransferase [Roseovarius sp. SYSU LYC5161]|uniref:class I SAM-dependent methyltransferase n=1 Tax=Roseovarius halophilus (ex Wu et al. 2025) TaxID=3376060 RepID=UPI002871AA4E|nr:class I SAM-dependent methyltransferase [Roseovarius sp.]
MTRDSETLRVYGGFAADYAAMMDTQSDDPQLAAFIGGVRQGGHVLDLGCGPGWAAARMVTAGLTVDATDAVPEMVELASAQPGVSARLATFDDISGNDQYDGIWANFSLLHAPRTDLPRHLAALRATLKSGGLFHIGMKTGKGEKRDRLGRLYTYVDAEELHALLYDAGFSPFSSRTGRDKGMAGQVEDWITMAAHG